MGHDSVTTGFLDSEKITFEDFCKGVLNDYRIAVESRETSLLGRREVLTGKAKFGIFGDGKEVPQIAMAKVFKEGDWRAGYYRDQTFMMAAGLLTVKEFFAQLYAHTDVDYEPASAGRMMNGHFGTRFLDKKGNWKSQTEQKNSSSDISPTAAQMPRALGLAMASKFYRNNKELKSFKEFSNNGNEVTFVTIGDASTSEGHFWETLNAAAVTQVPLIVNVWDDGYGISVPKEYQTVKGSISEALRGFEKDENGPGILIYNVKAWDYPNLIETYQKATAISRMDHIPVLIHVEECTQPQGHSTSGSHERYKSKERLEWEGRYDCILKMREWILASGIAEEETLVEVENEAKKFVRESKRQAWEDYINPIKEERAELIQIINEMEFAGELASKVQTAIKELSALTEPIRKDIMNTARMVYHWALIAKNPNTSSLKKWISKQNKLNYDRYNSHLYSQSKDSALKVKEVKPQFPENPVMVDGRVILRENYDLNFKKYPQLLAFGEDTGKIGGVNQTLEGLQQKYGENRIFDTGIREATIIGQGIGMALRGLKPIAEIQYLDYLLYGLQPLSDDLATLQYRTKGGQKAPLIVSTRGHRLEGIWHSGSPMGMIINSLRGMYVCVPRNFTQAAGMYNTLLQSDEPALVIEPLNGYRLKEKLPSNLGDYNIPLGVPEILNEGCDITLVTYGSCVRIAQEAMAQLSKIGISVELIDIQTLLPFDLNHIIKKSIAKTNRLLVLDEDVPGGASAYILQQIIEDQDAFLYLDSKPRTLSAKSHRPAYGTDGDYFSKPSADDVFEVVYEMMNESKPANFPLE